MPEGKKCFEYELAREGENKVLKVYLEGCTFPASLEDSEVCMAKLVDALVEAGVVTSIVLNQQRDYEYDFTQTQLLNELAQLYKMLAKDERYSFRAVAPCEQYIRAGFTFLQRMLSTRLKGDPIGVYVELHRQLRHEKLKLNTLADRHALGCQEQLVMLMEHALNQIGRLKLMALATPHLTGYQPGSRELYRVIFHPTTRPDFVYTKLQAEYPAKGIILESYETGSDVEKTEVTIFGFPDSVKTLYHIMPPEFKLTEEKYELLDAAKRIMAEHKPTREEFVDPERTREVFFTLGKDLLEDLSHQLGIALKEKEIIELAHILLRYTIGFGLIEVLLSDEKIQDVNINSPPGAMPIFLVHQSFGDCVTNIFPTQAEVDGWGTKLRLLSGRPLDEANPILDTELRVPGFTARVAAISKPLNPTGLGFSFRRHRDFPWTFPLYMSSKVRMFNPLAAGLMSFLIDNNATMLIAGTRSSGKTSLLGSFLVELMRRSRIITVEDTLELPIEPLLKLGFNIQQLKVASALGAAGTEVAAEIGIRATLRLGDSALIVGEVRSKEAVALYEAMRVGAAANIVAGTIHGASPYGVFDRVVNDIGVPKTSFKATDIVVVANPVRTAAGTKKVKRVLSITEIRKEWEEDPLKENGFVDLMKYDPKTDELVVTDDLVNGNSEILKGMAARIKEFAGDWDALWDNIVLRGNVKKSIVDIAEKIKDQTMLEAPFVVRANDRFHLLTEKVHKEVGSLDSKRILFEFNEWLKSEAKKRGV